MKNTNEFNEPPQYSADRTEPRSNPQSNASRGLICEHNGGLRPVVVPAEELQRRGGVAEEEEVRGEEVGEELVKTCLALRYLDGE